RKLVYVDLDAVLWRLAAIKDPSIVVPADLALPPRAVVAEPADAAPAAAPATSEPAAPATPSPTAAGPSGESTPGGTRRPAERTAETIRVDVERLDSLMNLVGELVLGRNRLLQLIGDLEERAADEDLQRELSDTSSQIDFITTELQSAVMRTRMVQIGRVFKKFPRVVRDLARDLKKDITLVVEGEETELDKSLIEEISDPLVHLIRNACDHGIETPEERRARGKAAQGTVRLAASHEGNNIVIEIEDDGAGIDAEVLKQKAIEKNLITPAEAEEMSDTEAYQLIFRAGFSTAKALTNVSGRGVGMDVVKSNIAKLNGTISIQSEKGKGSRFTLKFPLTLAIIQSLLVRVGPETFAIPLHAVSEVVGLTPRDIKTVNSREVIRLREEVLPLLRISDVMQVPRTERSSEMTYAVVVGVGHQRLGLVVDSLIGQKEIVIKPLGDYLKKVPGIAGSTILGDGRVIMILDIGEAVQLEARSRQARGSVVASSLLAT
ncbi:MAG: chemotaxis protein CheA, partial [Bacteroidetes bacterium]